MDAKNFIPFMSDDDDRERIFDPQEISALIKYASEQGVADSEQVSLLFDELRAWEAAEVSKDRDIQKRATRDMLSTYTTLTRQLHGVNGRTLLYGRNLAANTAVFMLTTFLFFLLSVGSLAITSWFGDAKPPEEWLNGYGLVVLHVLQ